MATFKFDRKTKRATIYFRFKGRQFKRRLSVGSEREAERASAIVEETIQDLSRGKIAIPPGADVGIFLLSGGKFIGHTETKPATSVEVTLADLLSRYRSSPPPHLEPSTRRMVEIHFRRLTEGLAKIGLKDLGKAAAQAYVTRRSGQQWRGQRIHRDTIKKELKSLLQAWAWVRTQNPEFPDPPFRLRDVVFPKATEALPFMTMSEITQEIARGGHNPREIKSLWDSLWLDREQVRELLAHVEHAAAPAFMLPMVAFAAYSGARRSELCRSRIADWRFSDQVVKIRQKKRDLDKEFTFRDVPIHPRLAEIMERWFAVHPGGGHVFCQTDRREVTWNMATHYFNQAIRGSKFENVRGWHVLRHSFASNLAAAGVDQRHIDAWMGHSTSIRTRYQHLRPKDQQSSISVL
jgi:integrase